ncbi:hypothetical protein PG993_003019 [Apiospora rasikravindrae]|uniref:C2H2-type domain-containing protein n=1 Tax=Apiospora rasikravindrae TaxID=990691 RepID=A0ABR1U112_9PEZI
MPSPIKPQDASALTQWFHQPRMDLEGTTGFFPSCDFAVPSIEPEGSIDLSKLSDTSSGPGYVDEESLADTRCKLKSYTASIPGQSRAKSPEVSLSDYLETVRPTRIDERTPYRELPETVLGSQQSALFDSGLELYNVTPSSSHRSSLDPDMLSIASSLDCSVTSDPSTSGDRLKRIISAVDQRLFRGVSLPTNASSSRLSIIPEHPTDAPATRKEIRKSPNTLGADRRACGPLRKRKRYTKDHRDETQDEQRASHNFRTPTPGLRDVSRKHMACPFWKRDARRHRDCFKLKLDGIARVKQHLSRSHYSESHCERCKLVFASNSARENHLRFEQCQWRGSDALEGISHKQRNDLSKKSKPGQSESDRWFAIWVILFPGEPAPSSAYIDPDLSEDLSEFRLYSENNGTRILMEELERGELTDDLRLSEGNRHLLRAALSRGQDMVFEAWLATREPPSCNSASFDRSTTSAPRESPDLDEQGLNNGVSLIDRNEFDATSEHLRTCRTFDLSASEQIGQTGAYSAVLHGTQHSTEQLPDVINMEDLIDFDGADFHLT